MANKIIFETDPDLGGVVTEAYKIYKTMDLNTVLKYRPNAPVELFNQFLRDMCNSKFGFLLGFTFVSNKPNVQRRIFSIVYIPKIKSALMRQTTRGASHWETWQHISDSDKIVLSDAQLKAEYGFDINKFKQSDYCEDGITELLGKVQDQVKNTFMPYFNRLPTSDERTEAKRLLTAITDSYTMVWDDLRRGEVSFDQTDFDRKIKDRKFKSR